MFNLKDLLVKFKSIQDPSEKKKVIIGILNEIIGAEILKNNEIETRNHILFLKAHSAVKNKIFMQKKNVVEKINNVLPEECIVDIR